MNRILAGLVFSALLAVPSVFAFSTIDKVLESYKINPALEGSFVQDGAVTAFWNSWVGDSMDMTTASNSWLPGGATWAGGAADAEMIVKSAYGVKGIYFYFLVKDDSWYPPADFSYDALDLIFDKNSAATIMAAAAAGGGGLLTGFLGGTTTFNSLQVQVSMGGSGVPSTVDLFYWNGAAMTRDIVAVGDLTANYDGMMLDVINSVGGAANSRVCELFLPWKRMGAGGGLSAMPATDQLFAGQFGYNDADPGETTPFSGGYRTLLRWQEKDAFNNCNDATPPHAICNSWGDIKIDVVEIGTIGKLQNSVRAMGKVLSSSFYTLKGEKISNVALKNLKNGSMVIRKDLMEGNSIHTQMISVR